MNARASQNLVDTYSCDVVVVGGGIAGLWTANRLAQKGLSVVVLESRALGGGQTLASQGILHGGVKYGIDGANREVALRLKGLPPRWLACIVGQGELDLKGIRVLAQEQYLWSRDLLLGGFASAMARKAMQGEVQDVPKQRWPEVFRSNPPTGSLYAVKEVVLDILSVVAALSKPLRGNLVAGDIKRFLSQDPGLEAIEVTLLDGVEVRFEANAFVFTAGTGNERASEALGFGSAATQRRPLRMVMARGMEFPVYGHCVTASPKPRATITSHPHASAWVWYLGGEIAEKGVSLSPAEALERTRVEMRSIFPSVRWGGVEWACHDVDRAEPLDSKGHLPHEPRLLATGNTLIAWPAKLVYAPLLADRVLTSPTILNIPSSSRPSSDFSALPQAVAGCFPWQLPLAWTRL